MIFHTELITWNCDDWHKFLTFNFNFSALQLLHIILNQIYQLSQSTLLCINPTSRYKLKLQQITEINIPVLCECNEALSLLKW